MAGHWAALAPTTGPVGGGVVNRGVQSRGRRKGRGSVWYLG